MKTEGHAHSTRERLLEAAERLFFKKGYEGVSVRDLTDMAGTNIASINYHFKGKDNLYREVFRQRLSRMAERKLAELSRVTHEKDPPDLREVFRSCVSGFLGDILSSRDMENFLNVVSHEMSEPGMATDILMKEIVTPVHKVLKEAVQKARPDLAGEKVSLCIVSLIGQMFHFVRAREIIKRVVGRGYSKEFLNEVVEHITDFSLKGMG
jgi:AcrR family transcriptional regulator